MWQGLQTITDYKWKHSRELPSDSSLPENLNDFYTHFKTSKTEACMRASAVPDNCMITLSIADNWHKGCFHCEVCKMTLNMKNYKGYDKKPYCNAHYPKQSFTIVTDTPENLRLRHQSELQSQVKYKKDFEDSKGRGFSIVSDTPEQQRLRKTQEQISNVCFCVVTSSISPGLHGYPSFLFLSLLPHHTPDLSVGVLFVLLWGVCQCYIMWRNGGEESV
ncbi:uncharacterized protein LOC135517264 isoform X1 [Oncorhynchus masou masou]|uniref:uncharacterized protein LOC135517264 isoform X1 n=1 Tax=Oncorhynchus masou masou TaxID=90313 RepID=UPI00318381EB